MSEELVKIKVENNVALVTLNRPDALNALSTPMRTAIVQTMETVQNDDEVKSIVLTGEGRAFCAGLDLKELGAGTGDNADAVSDANLIKAFRKVSKPVIGAINGFAITGGFELALMCDFMIAGENAKFADTHGRIGIVPGWGLSQKLPRLIGVNRAKQMSFSGMFVDAHKAEAWGLVNEVVAQEQLVDHSVKMAEDIAGADPSTLKTLKEIIDQGWNGTLGEGLKIEAAANVAHMDGVTPEILEQRRHGVMSRGREKS